MAPLSRQYNGKQYYYYAHYYLRLQVYNMRDKVRESGYPTRITYGRGKWTLWVGAVKEGGL